MNDTVMLAKIRVYIIVLNMQHTTPNSKREHSDIPCGGTYKTRVLKTAAT